MGSAAKQVGKGVVRAGRSAGGPRDRQQLAADLRLVAGLDGLLSSGGYLRAIDGNGVAGVVDDGAVAAAKHQLGMQARDAALGAGKYQLLVVSAADAAAKLVDRSSAAAPLELSTVSTIMHGLLESCCALQTLQTPHTTQTL